MTLGGPVQTCTLRRYTAGSYSTTTGLWTSGTPADSSIVADVQPAPGTTWTLNEDGSRSPHTVEVFTTDALQSADQHAGTVADLLFVPRFNAWFQVQRVADHAAPGMGLAHYEIIAQRMKEQPS